MVTSSSAALAAGGGLAPGDRERLGERGAPGVVVPRVQARRRAGRAARAYPGDHGAADGAGRPRRSPADADRQDRRRPAARTHARDPRRRYEHCRRRRCRGGARAGARARTPGRALHRRRRQPHARGVVAADRASVRQVGADVSAPLRDRRRGGAVSTPFASGSPAACPRFRSRACAWGGSRCTRRAPRLPASSGTVPRAPLTRSNVPCAGIATTAMPPDARVKAVCAMGVEAWGVRRRARDVRVVQVGIGGRPRAGMSGIVISAGLCGGLLPGQGPGTVVIPTQVVDEWGVSHACDPGVVAALERAARYLRLPVSSGSLISTSGMVTGAARGTWAGRGHVAVDMELAAVAESASRFGVLRVILDTPTRELSAAWAVPGARDPAPVELGRGDLAWHQRAALLAPGGRDPRGGLPRQYRPRGIAAPLRGASARPRGR